MSLARDIMRATPLIGAILLVLVIIAVSHLSAIGNATEATKQLRDALHAPAFAVFTLVIYVVAFRFFGPNRGLLVAIAIVIGTALFGEGIQAIGPGDASLQDFGNDLLGILAGGLVCAIWRRPKQPKSVRGPKITVAVVATIACAVIAIPVWKTLKPMYLRSADTASLYVAGEDWRDLFFETQYGATLETVPAIARWPESSQLIGRMVLSRQSYSGIHFEPPADWTLFNALQLPISAGTGQTIRLTLSVNDASYNGGYSDRYNHHFDITDVPRIIRIPLAEMVSPSGRQIDLGNVSDVYIFHDSPSGIETIYLGRVTLAF